MAERRYIGWRKEPEDRRDYKLSVPVKIPLPEDASLQEFESPNQSQYATSSCVGNACVNGMELLHIKEFGKPHHDDLSRLFTYWNARTYIGEEFQDAGCFIRDCIKGLARFGVCYEKIWPFDGRLVTKEPTRECYREAEKMQILKYSRISESDRVYQVKYAIHSGFPVIFGMQIYDNFDRGKKGVIPMPAGAFLGGHAMLITSYSSMYYPDGEKRVGVLNSWGREWGDGGRCYVPEGIISDPKLSSDYWVIQIVENDQMQVEKPAWNVYLWYWLKRIFYLKGGK